MGRQGDIAFRRVIGGTLIRHVTCGQPLPVGPLTVPVIEPSFNAPLMTDVGGTSLLTAPFGTAEVAAILLSPITVAADPENDAATLCPAKPLTQNNFVCVGHSRPKARLDISGRSWQLKAICLCNLLSECCWQWASVAEYGRGLPSRPSGTDYTRMMTGAAPLVRMMLRSVFVGICSENYGFR
jgi:hypothetical protein